eukprot:495865_1
MSSLRIHVKILRNSKSITLYVNPSDEIKCIKRQIENREKISVSTQHLIFSGSTLVGAIGYELEDWYDIKTHLTYDSTIYLVNKLEIQIFVKRSDDYSKLVSVTYYDTIQHIKDIVQSSLKIPSREQILSFNGKCLENENIVAYYAINEDDILHLTELYPPLATYQWKLNRFTSS